MRKKESLRDRVISRLVITPSPTLKDRLGRPLVGPCLVWQGAKLKGYGYIDNKRVHRVMYEMFVSPIAHTLDHLCRVTDCASPAHLEDVTQAENTRRSDVGIRERSRTNCPKGHPYDSDNTKVDRAGSRNCRACDREKWRLANGVALGAPNRHDPNRCVNGHPRTEENTLRSLVNGKERKRCRACLKASHERSRAKLSRRAG